MLPRKQQNAAEQQKAKAKLNPRLHRPISVAKQKPPPVVRRQQQNRNKPTTLTPQLGGGGRNSSSSSLSSLHSNAYQQVAPVATNKTALGNGRPLSDSSSSADLMAVMMLLGSPDPSNASQCDLQQSPKQQTEQPEQQERSEPRSKSQKQVNWLEPSSIAAACYGAAGKGNEEMVAKGSLLMRVCSGGSVSNDSISGAANESAGARPKKPSLIVTAVGNATSCIKQPIYGASTDEISRSNIDTINNNHVVPLKSIVKNPQPQYQQQHHHHQQHHYQEQQLYSNSKYLSSPSDSQYQQPLLSCAFCLPFPNNSDNRNPADRKNYELCTGEGSTNISSSSYADRRNKKLTDPLWLSFAKRKQLKLPEARQGKQMSYSIGIFNKLFIYLFFNRFYFTW